MEILAYVTIGILFTIALIAFMLLMVVLHQKKQHENKKEKILLKAHFEQELLQTQLEIQEQTLKYISEEIHDNVGQALSLAKLNLNTMELITDDKTRQKAHQAQEMVSKAIIDLRNLSKSLHGDKIGQLGLLEAIRSELKIIENSGQFITQLNINGNPYNLEPQREMILFRIAQVAVGNAVKHSKATNITVTLEYSDTKITLMVEDDGTGFDPQSLKPTQTGIGLTSIYNRANLIEGIIFVNSSIGTGTVVSIEVASK
jgi:two-component system, NarL family, sensor kinase